MSTNHPDITILPGSILVAPQFNEPMQVISAERDGDAWQLCLKGTQSRKFVDTELLAEDLAEAEIHAAGISYDGDGELLRLGARARMLDIAWEYDPCFALSVSRVDLLPHQLEAVYDHLLKAPRTRFLLADDAGAGKTVMAGLLARELQLRGLAERVLVACPANLTFQWQREMLEKFGERFFVVRGDSLREQYGVNIWQEHSKVIVSLDLAKRGDILPGLRRARWHLSIVDEAHRMSWTPPAGKSERYKLGELLRDASEHMLLLTATPHKGDPKHFSRFLQLLDRDAYEGARSIQEAMQNNFAPFYLRRVKEAMVRFPELDENGQWTAHKIFTRRNSAAVKFQLAEDGDEFDLYRDVSDFVKRQSRRAAERGADRRARAVGFLMTLYQRRLASSAAAIRRSLERRAARLEKELTERADGKNVADAVFPDPEELEEMDDEARENAERQLDAAGVLGNPEDIRAEIAELRELAGRAAKVEESGGEVKLAKLRKVLESEKFAEDPSRRLLIFTEFRDTLNGLAAKLREWGFKVGVIHGGMHPGDEKKPNTRLFVERQFRDGDIQILVATEAAGEGVNLQSCNILFNYDIPWNPNRLEQRMGRIHRYGQTKDCFFFNFVAENTIEGGVLIRLLEKLEEIRKALRDDSVFDVVGDILPAAKMESVFREYYAGGMGGEDLQSRLLDDVNVESFRKICQNALEGLAVRNVNLPMMVQRKARARAGRIVPETVSRFVREAAGFSGWKMGKLRGVAHGFVPGPTPSALMGDAEERGEAMERQYPKCAADREAAERAGAEWLRPGHPIYEALRRDIRARAEKSPGAKFYSLRHDRPARMDFYTVRICDGNNDVVRERIFVVELSADCPPQTREPGALEDFEPAPASAETPPDAAAVAALPEQDGWLRKGPVRAFLGEARKEREAQTEMVRKHVESALTELIERADGEIGRNAEEKSRGTPGAEGRAAQAEERHDSLVRRRRRRMEHLKRQKSLTSREIGRFASALILPHPARGAPELSRMRPNFETEAASMRAVMEYESAQGRIPEDVHEKNLGYDISSVDPRSGELRLIEVKGLAGGDDGEILLTPNEHRVARDRPDCYWLYVVVDCAENPVIRSRVRNPAEVPMRPVAKIAHYRLRVRDLDRGESEKE